MGNKPMRTFVRFDETASTEETNTFLWRLSARLLDRVSDGSLKTFVGMAINGQHIKELCLLELDYSRLTANDAFYLGQIQAFFKKREDIDLGVDRRAIALGKFREAETLCGETNRIINLRSKGLFCFSPRVESVLFRAQRKIAQILGDVPSLAELEVRFGQGSTTSTKKADACPRNKLGSELHCSSELAPFVHEVLAEMPGWFGTAASAQGETLRVGSREGDADGFAPESQLAVREIQVSPCIVEFVPKTWKTDRAIAKEPVLNGICQLAIGDYMVSRLLQAGCDLKNGQATNRAMAREGSQTGGLATLDLSSASDTVSRGIVSDLLPIDWVFFLEKFRSGHAFIGETKETLRQEKFSSMGNGFTFPLETLIFYSIASSVSERAYVYGDDIIVKTEAVKILVEVLTACGFVVNRDKSFVDGPFRESCGGDYFEGIDVRPCFVKNRLTGASLFTLHNFFAARHDDEVTSYIRRRISNSLAIEGPLGYGDGHLHASAPFYRRKGSGDGWGGVCFDTYQLSPRKSVRISKGDYVLPAYSIYMTQGSSKRAFYESNPGGNSTRSGWRFPAHRRYHYLLGLDKDHVDNGSGHPEFVEAPAEVAGYDRKGSLQVTLPGADGYKRISIYINHRPT